MTCKWVDDTLNRCASRAREIYKDSTKSKEDYPYCKWCGADIRKPEPEVIIKKSGGTWVKRENGIDLLWTCHTDGHESMNPDNWKPISEIEITDNIALLRPMVINRSNQTLEKLLGVIKGDLHMAYYIKPLKNDQWELATVSDLADKTPGN